MTLNCLHLMCLILWVSSYYLKEHCRCCYIGTVKQKMRELFNVSADNEIRLWGCSGFQDQILTNHNQTLYDAYFSKTQVLVNSNK